MPFYGDDMGLNTVDHNNINLIYDDFHEDDPETIIHVRCMACVININNAKHAKIDKHRIYACSMASNMLIELVHVRRWGKKKKKKKRTVFDW